MLFPRVTLRVITKDLSLKLPQMGEPLIDPNHPILNKAQDLQNPVGNSRLDSIQSIDDNRFYRFKPTDATRAAIWFNSSSSHEEIWIVAVGNRLGDSYNDFYKGLERTCTKKLKEKRVYDPGFNSNKSTYSDHLLPTADDYDRLKLDLLKESQENDITKIANAVELAKKSLNIVQKISVFGIDVEILVTSNEYDELYVGIAMNNSSYKKHRNAIMIAAAPYLDKRDWYIVPNNDLPKGLSGYWNFEYYEALLEPGWHRLTSRI